MWSNVAALPCPQQTNDLTAARLNVSGGGRYIGGSRILEGEMSSFVLLEIFQNMHRGKVSLRKKEFPE